MPRLIQLFSRTFFPSSILPRLIYCISQIKCIVWHVIGQYDLLGKEYILAGTTLFYIGAAIIFAWGLAHIAPVRSITRGFGDISADNRRIITMTWVSEGLSLCFIGVIVFVSALTCGPHEACANIVYISSAAMLIVGAVWTALTGARTRIIPMKICPIIKLLVAALLIIGIV